MDPSPIVNCRTCTDLKTREPSYSFLLPKPIQRVSWRPNNLYVRCNSYLSYAILICQLYIFCAQIIAFCYMRGRRDTIIVSVTKQSVTESSTLICYFYTLRHTLYREHIWARPVRTNKTNPEIRIGRDPPTYIQHYKKRRSYILSTKNLVLA